MSWSIVDENLYYEYNANSINCPVCKYSSYNKTNLKIKTTDDDKYCAVYNENDLYCDFYTYEYDAYVYKKNVGEYLFTMRRNNKYKNDEVMIIDFVMYKNKQHFFFHSKFGTLDVRDMQNNIIAQRTTKSIFIQSLHKVNNDYFACLINLTELIENKNCTFPVIWKKPEYYGIYQHSLYNINIKNNKIHYEIINDIPIVDDKFIEYEKLIENSNFDEAYAMDDPNDDFEIYPKLTQNYIKYNDDYEFDPEYIMKNYTNELFNIFIV